MVYGIRSFRVKAKLVHTIIITWLTYLLTPCSRALLEKLTGSAASQEIPPIFGTRRFITVLTSARHLSLSWTNSIQSPQPTPTSWRSILILSFHLRLGLPNGLFPSGFPTRTLYSPLPCPAHFIILDFTTRTLFGKGVQITKLFIMQIINYMTLSKINFRPKMLRAVSLNHYFSQAIWTPYHLYRYLHCTC